MKRKTNTLQVAHWTEDPAQQDEFLLEVSSRIDRESAYIAPYYGEDMYKEDFAQDVRVKLLEQIHTRPAAGPFAKDTPKEAAASLLETYEIREQIRLLARKEFRKHSRQAEILHDIPQKDLPPDAEADLRAIAKSFPRIEAEVPDVTKGDKKIVRKEVLRRCGIGDLPEEIADQIAEASGISSAEQREYNEYHAEHGHNSAKDRKALSRALGKVVKAISRTKLLSLLSIVFAFSLALDAGDQGRSMHEIFGSPAGLIHQTELAHQNGLIHQTELAHQGTDTDLDSTVA